MKKLLTALLAVLLLLSFAGCSSKQAEPEPAKEETARNETEKEETKEEAPAPEENKEDSSEKPTISLSSVYDYTIPEDWKEVDKFVFEAAGGEVYVYMNILTKRAEGLDVVPEGMKVTDDGFADVWSRYMEEAFGAKIEYGALPGYAAKSGGGVDYYHAGVTLVTGEGRYSELMDIYDYSEDYFFLVEYNYGPMMVGKANDCAKAFNDTLGYSK